VSEEGLLSAVGFKISAYSKNLRDAFLLHINDAYSGDISQYNGIGIGVKVNLSIGQILLGFLLGNKKRSNKI